MDLEPWKLLVTCVAHQPGSPLVYIARGLARGLTGKFEECKHELDHALELKAGFAPALLNPCPLSKQRRMSFSAVSLSGMTTRSAPTRPVSRSAGRCNPLGDLTPACRRGLEPGPFSRPTRAG